MVENVCTRKCSEIKDDVQRFISISVYFKKVNPWPKLMLQYTSVWHIMKSGKSAPTLFPMLVDQICWPTLLFGQKFYARPPSAITENLPKVLHVI